MFTLAIDCMGADKGSKVCVEAIKLFLEKHNDVKIVAFGRMDELAELNGVNNVEIVDCPDVMEMTAGAMEAMRARTTSMYEAVSSMKKNDYQGIVSAGSTGAFLTLASVKLKNIDGVTRAALVTAIPTYGGKLVTVLDVGANVDTSSDQLVQFAKMGRIYSQHVLNVENPRVYLLSNGAEDEKGSAEVKEANKLLRENNFPNFLGNIEGREVAFGDLDVLVTGGYAGNIFLKTYEGVAKMMSNMIKDAFYKNVSTKIGYLFAKKGFDELKQRMSYESVGGAMLIGVNGVVVKAHGSSNADAFYHAIVVCYNLVKANVLDLIKEGVTENA